MRGWIGLVGTFLPFLVILAAVGFLRGRRLWLFSLGVHSLSLVCLALLTAGFYSGAAGGPVYVVSPTLLGGGAWSSHTSLSWMFHNAALSLAAATVVLCFHFIGRPHLERSRATLGGMAGYLGCLLGALGAGNLFLFSLFVAGAIVPRFIFAGVDAKGEGIEAAKETGFLSIVALFCLLICVLVFSDAFRPALDQWFVIDGGTHAVLPGSIGFTLLLLAMAILAELPPFHGGGRKAFELYSIERAVPLALQSLFGFVLLFRFSIELFPKEFLHFGPALLGFFSLGTAYSAANLVGARGARDRIFWLRQCSLSLAAVGFFSATPMGWHGGAVLLFFQALSVPFLLVVLACHERRPGQWAIARIGEFPLFSVSTAAAVLFGLFLPVSVGFYGVLLVVWSLVGTRPWYLPFVILAVPVVALAGIRMMFFHLGGGERRDPEAAPMSDLSREEVAAILPLAALLFLLGLVPKILMGPIGVSAAGLLRAMGVQN